MRSLLRRERDAQRPTLGFMMALAVGDPKLTIALTIGERGSGAQRASPGLSCPADVAARADGSCNLISKLQSV